MPGDQTPARTAPLPADEQLSHEAAEELARMSRRRGVTATQLREAALKALNAAFCRGLTWHRDLLAGPPRPTRTAAACGRPWRVGMNDGRHTVDLEGTLPFDELVVGDWFHLERLSDRGWFLQIGSCRFSVWTGPKRVDLRLQEGEVLRG